MAATEANAVGTAANEMADQVVNSNEVQRHISMPWEKMTPKMIIGFSKRAIQQSEKNIKTFKILKEKAPVVEQDELKNMSLRINSNDKGG